MAQKSKNTYGRQIFLSREEIRLLRDIVATSLMREHDFIGEMEDVRDYEQDVTDAKARVRLMERLVGDGVQDLQGKLWYYISAEESEQHDG